MLTSITVNDEYIAVLIPSCLLWNHVIRVIKCVRKSNSHLCEDAAWWTDLQLEWNNWWPSATLKWSKLVVTLSLPPLPSGPGDAGLASVSHLQGPPTRSPSQSWWHRVYQADQVEAAAASPPAVWESRYEEPQSAEETEGEDLSGHWRQKHWFDWSQSQTMESSGCFSFTSEKFLLSL